MSIQCLVTPGLAINTYLVIDPSTHRAVVIDATCNLAPVLECIEREKAKVTAILETHVHADFASGAKLLKAALHGEPTIYCSGMGGKEWLPTYADRAVSDGMEIPLGESRLQAWHCPGHTPEHVMWVLFDDLISPKDAVAAFTGDFLLIGSVGRPDLLGEEQVQSLAKKLYQSVFEVLPKLPDRMKIYPAHGAGSLCGKGIGNKASSTLGAEKSTNSFLAPKEQQAWIQDLLANIAPPPPYFARMKRTNLQGPRLDSELPEMKKLSLEMVEKGAAEGLLLVDVRSPEKFAAGHIKGSINVPAIGSFMTWAPIVISYDTPLALVRDSKALLEQAKASLRIVGLDEIVAEVVIEDREMAGMESFQMVAPEVLQERLAKGEQGLLIVDVRTPGEWAAGHIAGAMHIEMKQMDKRWAELPTDRTIGLVCGSGYRASIAASLLQKHGIIDVFNVTGGMQAWQKAGLPMTS